MRGGHQRQHPPPMISSVEASSSTSPAKRPTSFPPGRNPSWDTVDEEQGDSDSDDGITPAQRDKLEVKREKNRVKQRNLRLRRANHITQLESALASLESQHKSLRTAHEASASREANLQAWIRDLEGVLYRSGAANDVESLRRVWSASTGVDVKQDSRSGSDGGGGALGALVQAATWEGSAENYATAESRKRKREETHPNFWSRNSLSGLQPPPSAPPNVPRHSSHHILPPLPAFPFSQPAQQPRPQTAPYDPSRSNEPSPRAMRIENLLSPTDPNAPAQGGSDSPSERRWSGDVSDPLATVQTPTDQTLENLHVQVKVHEMQPESMYSAVNADTSLKLEPGSKSPMPLSKSPLAMSRSPLPTAKSPKTITKSPRAVANSAVPVINSSRVAQSLSPSRSPSPRLRTPSLPHIHPPQPQVSSST